MGTAGGGGEDGFQSSASGQLSTGIRMVVFVADVGATVWVNVDVTVRSMT
jgi:hypothetical protein